MIISIPDERVEIEIDDQGYLIVVRPMAGTDSVTWWHAKMALEILMIPPATELRRHGWREYRATRRECSCVLPEQHCPACDAAAKKAYQNGN